MSTAAPTLLTDLRKNTPQELESVGQEILLDIARKYGESMPYLELQQLSEILSTLKFHHDLIESKLKREAQEKMQW